jgi:hypothetical protein
MSYIEDIRISSANSMSTDAFGRFRVSEAHTLFDSKNLNESGSLFWDSLTTGGGKYTIFYII